MRGHIERRGARSWRLKWDMGRDPLTGARQIRRKAVRGTKREAEAELARILGAIQAGTYVDPHKLTLGHVLERWRDDVASVRVSAKTFERYREHVARLIQGLGSVPLLKLHPLTIEAFYGQLRTSGHSRHGGGLSEQTLLHIHKVLVAALGQAVRWRLIAHNPARDVNAPVPRRLEITTLDAAAMARLLKGAEGTPLYVPVLLLLTTGLRRGELLGLRWTDLDRARGRLTIVRTLEETRAGLAFKTPKTARSARAVPLPRVALDALAEHEVAQKRHRLASGSAFQDEGLIFPDDDGTPHRPRALTKAFAALAQRAHVPSATLHGLRHTHVTELLRAGVHPKVVSERVGHSSVAFTLQRYGHALPDMQQNAADETERLVGSLVGR